MHMLQTREAHGPILAVLGPHKINAILFGMGWATEHSIFIILFK